MMNKKLIIPMIATSLALILNSFSVRADDCSISINSKESFKCLQRKISKLESELDKRKKYQMVLPKGAIVDFSRKICPKGWVKFRVNKNEVANSGQREGIIKCQSL